MKFKIVLLLLCGLAFLVYTFVNGALKIAATQEAAVAMETHFSLYPDPISRLQVAGHSASRLATPQRLPFERTLPGPITDWLLMTADGRWGNEYKLRIQPLKADGFRYAQRSGRSCQDLKPWFMLANRRTGQGLGLMLAYMGNWTIRVGAKGQQLSVRLDTAPGGLQPFMTVQGLPIPGVLVSEFTGHWDYGTQPIVNFIREKLQRDLGPDWPPVQYNTWYDTYDKITQAQLFKQARLAAEAGCELFTVDAGWYGFGRKEDWSKGLGAWDVNRARFPDGLEAVAAEVRSRGMKFGLWFELECAAPGSLLAKAHPDWFLKDGLGRRIGARDVLDFGNPEVLDFARQVITDAMERLRLDYIKMDFNVDPAINNQDLEPEEDPLYRHYRGLAGLWAWMREQYPALIVENCASGSLRQELTAAALTDTHWISDEVDNHPNLPIMLGATYLFPPSICSHWTARPDRKDEVINADAQFAVNMMGHLGLSGAIADWDEKTLEMAKARIAQYKQIRPLLRRADVFHLTQPHEQAMQTSLYVDPETGNALLFAFHNGDPVLQHAIRLRGLEKGMNYRLAVLEGPDPATVQGPMDADGAAAGGKLLEDGLNVTFPNPGAAVVIELKVEAPNTIAMAGSIE